MTASALSRRSNGLLQAVHLIWVIGTRRPPDNPKQTVYEDSMTATRTPIEDHETARLTPLAFVPAVAIFLGLGAWVRFCIYSLIPFFANLGLHQFRAYLAGFIIGLSPFLPLTFVFLTQERQPLRWASLATRLGFQGAVRRTWLEAGQDAG
jgi:hypothetical protein